jgi:hypothetical protein
MALMDQCGYDRHAIIYPMTCVLLVEVDSNRWPDNIYVSKRDFQRFSAVQRLNPRTIWKPFADIL